ncbi:Os02g0300000 [Oryza sativa Japonica Group]|uniref:Os02g0300000 protein n=1 Tax=Oryza sativa subsp. japonica TaxID=39947 RepID=A0A0P0VHX9_ORYSJ|nr:Os02g0300000 [Oryza sativa Japonica Group]
MPDPDLVQWTNVRLDVPLVLLLVVQSALEAWLRPAEFESSPAPCLLVTDVLDSPSVPATAAYADGLTMDHPIMTTEFWTSHECLLLPYEQALPENIRKAILVYENLSNPYGIAGTLLHVQVSQSYLSKPVDKMFVFYLGM